MDWNLQNPFDKLFISGICCNGVKLVITTCISFYLKKSVYFCINWVIFKLFHPSNTITTTNIHFASIHLGVWLLALTVLGYITKGTSISQKLLKNCIFPSIIYMDSNSFVCLPTYAVICLPWFMWMAFHSDSDLYLIAIHHPMKNWKHLSWTYHTFQLKT